jgi:hypothetical protein
MIYQCFNYLFLDNQSTDFRQAGCATATHAIAQRGVKLTDELRWQHDAGVTPTAGASG